MTPYVFFFGKSAVEKLRELTDLDIAEVINDKSEIIALLNPSDKP